MDRRDAPAMDAEFTPVRCDTVRRDRASRPDARDVAGNTLSGSSSVSVHDGGRTDGRRGDGDDAFVGRNRTVLTDVSIVGSGFAEGAVVCPSGTVWFGGHFYARVTTGALTGRPHATPVLQSAGTSSPSGPAARTNSSSA